MKKCKSEAAPYCAVPPRSGDPLVISGYLGSGGGFAEALAKFGVHYADQTEKDWEELKRARKGKTKV